MNHENLKTSDTENPEFSDEMIGQIFGVYQIEREIGRGGMGVVYLAKRIDGAFNQDVAIKFLKRGMDTDAIIKRFRNERQILASLMHPNVALLFDGGTTEKGLPYFVMEYVEGEPLYKYCDRRKLTIKKRLKIFVQICDAVHAVHKLKVVHRDLKPSNLIVTKSGTPKLLDFGIAKLLDPELADATIEPTATQMRVMTPEYASPEQVIGGEISQVSDIYGLGVVFYELLSGHRPYRLKNRSAFEIARTIKESFPNDLSLSLSNKETYLDENEEKSPEKIAELRSATLSELNRQLSSDLEQIAINALQKQPEARYQTALDFAEDIRLFSQHKPIKKRAAFPEAKKIITEEIEQESPTNEFEAENIAPVEKKSNFLARHKFILGFSVILLFGIVTAFWFDWLDVRIERKNSVSESSSTKNQIRSMAILPFKNETADAGNDYLCDGLSENLINRLASLSDLRVMPRSASFSYKNKQIEPQEIGREMNVETILVGAVSKEADEFIVKIQLLSVADGMQLMNFGFREKQSRISILQKEIADVLSEKLNISPSDKPRVQKSYTENAEAFELYMKGEYHRQKAALEDIKKAIEYYENAIKLDENFALAHQGLALAYRIAPAYGIFSPQEAYPKAKDAAMNALAIDPTLGAVHTSLASIKFVYDWDFAGAETEYKQAIQLAPNSPEAHSAYANFLLAMGRSDEAINELKIAQQFDPLSTSISANIGWALYIAGRFDEAETQIKSVLERDPNSPRSLMNLGEIYEEKGKYDEAIAAFQRSKQLSGDPLTDMALGHVYAKSGRKAESLKIVQELEEKVRQKQVSPFLPAVVYAGLNDNDKAFYWLERAYQERSNWLALLKIGRRLKTLQNDPRYDDLLKRIGFPQ